MYEEMGKDFTDRQDSKPQRRRPAWGAAIRSFLQANSDTATPLPVSWLAKKTGMNEKNLHNIIAGRVQDPSSDKLVKISDALSISFTELASRAMGEDVGNFQVCSFSERSFIDYPQHGFTIHSFSPRSRSQRDIFWGRMLIKPFRELRKWQFRANSTVGIFLETGTLEIEYAGKKRTLHANEAVYFDAGVPHRIKNIDSIEAKLFIVTNPALF